MKFTLHENLPIQKLTDTELNELASLNVKKIFSSISESDQNRMDQLIKINYEFDLYEYENFDFIFFLEYVDESSSNIKTKIFYGKSESDEPNRDNYEKYNRKSWFSDTVYPEWHEKMKPIFEQAVAFLGLTEKIIYCPIRANFKGHNEKQNKWVSFLPTLNPNF